MADRLKRRVEKLLTYFSGFENEDGLLEKLKAWVFVEWSAASRFVQDVNYPTNMLYSAALACAARLYGDSAWMEKSTRIRQTIIRQSFNGSFFVDNAVRVDGKLKVTDNMSEVCQYFAFFFHIADPVSFPDLWKKLTVEFGPNRNKDLTYPRVHPANAFTGNYIRMDMLSFYGLQAQLLSEIQDYFYAMAEQTGTLWENMQSSASCNHGFASYLGHVLYRDVLAIKKIDYINKEITVCFSGIDLESCSGTIPVENELIALEWKRSGKTIEYTLKTPPGFSVKIDNKEQATLVKNKT
jgi:alpha-L-rhamnosidase